MSREDKEQFVQQMRQDVERAAGVLFLDYTGFTVAQAEVFRRKLREIPKVSYIVVKNTLMSRALEGTSFASAAKCLKGTPTGVVLGFEDPVTPAKITFEYLKECEQLKVKGGIVDKKAITPKEAEALSKLPSKAEMQGSIVALALSPGRKLAGQLKNPAGRIVGAIEALIKKLDA
jgi:large subunit ribosomal protein L10